MKSLVVVGLSVVMLSLGLFVPEGHAGKKSNEQKQQLLALKAQRKLALMELKSKFVVDMKALNAAKLAKELTRAEFKAEKRALKAQFFADKAALKMSGAGAVGINNGHGNSVPIPGTLLLFAGGFAGVISWRARQPAP